MPKGIKIINDCSKLPLGTIWHIRRTLGWLNPMDVMGVGSIRLADRIAEVDDPNWHRCAIVEGLSISGWYDPGKQDEPATITLFVRDLYRGIPALYSLSPVATLRIERTLSHEVGHHLITKQGFIFAPGEKLFPSEYEEEMAHRYSHSVIKRMRECWYYRLGTWATKDLAAWHYVQGMLNWRGRKYTRAAENWYRSFHLDPDRQDAIYWYKRARDEEVRRKAES